MEVSATAKYIKMSPFKIRLVANQVKKMPPQEAIKMLAFIKKSASPILKKVIASAIANAKNNHNLTEESLKFKEIQIGSGQMLKRYRRISRGRIHHILKRTSNIKVVLEAHEKPIKEAKPDVSEVSKVPKVSKDKKIEKEKDIERSVNGSKS
ncbi:50S ribosomal protein L22 [Candidatus Curtissbacteria bacterium RBG_13_35_7]|uniref:Large ribosomal subunit protein uL22 n=1 Tax=Candidatus Curtissbacteria bacterium RBG_13_35_7 TaxID=1797705 RepID=A0A1F5G0W0_9BACT|nr:MAG: 50S ribosomal protein L22 [Candidatus Curtissbacteria bacterium RBG_13_35_7]